MNTNTKIFLGFLVIIVSIYFLLHKKKKNPYRNLDENHKLLENFESKTASGRECLPWKDAVNFTEYGDSRECKNPEKDVNGNWCYTDSHGNYEYCDSYDPGCMSMKVLEGCFVPDKNGYQLVIYNSQPFNDKYLEIDQIADSTNKIWVLDQSGRFLRTAKKSKYLNFTWDDHINDSFNNYDVGLGPDQVFNITGMGVKMGGFKVKAESGSSSLSASEVCYLFLRNNSDFRRNRITSCLSSEKINIQGVNDNDYIQVQWKNDDLRKYINLSKKMDITRKDLLISIHKEKMRNTKGLSWGDIVFGKNNEGIMEFTSLGNTFPNSKFYDESTFTVSEDDENMRKYISASNKNFFSSDTLYFIHKIFSRLNQQTIDKSDEGMDIILGYLNGNVDNDVLEEGERNFINDFRCYLKYRILINDDFRFKEDGEFFNYSLKNKKGKLNDYFKEDNLFGILNTIPLIEYKKFITEKKEEIQNLVDQYDPSFLKSKLAKIDSNLRDAEYLKKLNFGGDEDNYNSDTICLENLKYSTRKDESFNSSVSLGQQIDGVLEQIKDIPLKGKNAAIKTKLKAFKENYNRSLKNFKEELIKTDTYILFMEAVDYLRDIAVKYNSKKTSREDKQKFINDNFGITDTLGINLNYANKKLYYRVILKMMNYYKSNVKDIYHNIFRRVEALQEKIKNESNTSDSSSTYYKLKNSKCHIEKEIYPKEGDAPAEEVTHYKRQDPITGESTRFTKINIRNLRDLGEERLQNAKNLLQNVEEGITYYRYFPDDIIDPEDAVNVTLYLKNDLYESKYELSDSKSGDNNYLFTYKLVYNADTGIISEFKHIYFKDGKIQNAPASLTTNAEKYGLPGFYTKKLSYLSQDDLDDRAKRYRMMVFDNNYTVIMDPTLHTRATPPEREVSKINFDNSVDRGNNGTTSVNILRNSAWNIFNYSVEGETIIDDSVEGKTIIDDIVNYEDLVGKNIYELEEYMTKENEKYFTKYDINYWSGFKDTLYKDDGQGKYGIFFSRVAKTYEGNKLNEGRTPTISAFKDDKFRFLLHSGSGSTGATRFYSLFQDIKTARENYVNKIFEVLVRDSQEKVKKLTNVTQGYIDNQKTLIAEKIKGSLEKINYHLKPHSLQRIDLVDKNLQESLDNLTELQKPELLPKESNFNSNVKSCTYTYTEIVRPPAPEPRNFEAEMKNRVDNTQQINGPDQYKLIKQYSGLDLVNDLSSIQMDDKEIEAETPETYRSYPNGWWNDSVEFKWSNLKHARYSVHPKISHGAYCAGQGKKDGVVDMESPQREPVFFTGIRTLGRADHPQHMKKFDIYYSLEINPNRSALPSDGEPHSDWKLIKKDAQGNLDGRTDNGNKIEARFNLNTYKFERPILARHLRIIGRDKHKEGHISFRCDYNFKYAYKMVKDFNINIEPKIKPDTKTHEALTIGNQRKFLAGTAAWNSYYNENDSLIGRETDRNGRYRGFHSQNSIQGRWKAEIRLESPKPVFFSGIRIQNRGQGDGDEADQACKKFNVYCSMDGKNFNKVVSERRILFAPRDKVFVFYMIDDFYANYESNFTFDKNDGKYGIREKGALKAEIVKPLTKIVRYVVELKEEITGYRENGTFCHVNSNEIMLRVNDDVPTRDTNSDQVDEDINFDQGNTVWIKSYKDGHYGNDKWVRGEVVKKIPPILGTAQQPAGYFVNYLEGENTSVRRVVLAESVSIRKRDTVKTINWDTDEFKNQEDGREWYKHLPVYGKFIKIEAYETTHPGYYTVFRCDYNYREVFNKDDTNKFTSIGYGGLQNYLSGKLTEENEKKYCVLWNPHYQKAISSTENSNGHIFARPLSSLDSLNSSYVFEIGEENYVEENKEITGSTLKNVQNGKYLTIETLKEENGRSNNTKLNSDWSSKKEWNIHMFYSSDDQNDAIRNRLFEFVEYQRKIKNLNTDNNELLNGEINDLEVVGINALASDENYNLEKNKQSLQIHPDSLIYHTGTQYDHQRGKNLPWFMGNNIIDPVWRTWEGFVIIPIKKIQSSGRDSFRRRYTTPYAYMPSTSMIQNPNNLRDYSMKNIRYHEDSKGVRRLVDDLGNFIDFDGNILQDSFSSLALLSRQRGYPDYYKILSLPIEKSQEFIDFKAKREAEPPAMAEYEKKTPYESPKEERNCFEDFVSQEVINIDKITEILKDIEAKGKHKTYTFDLNLAQIESGKIDKNTYNPSVKDSNILMPEVAQFLSEMQILLSSIKRSEELLRVNSTFFYELDDLIDFEDLKPNFTVSQWENINNIFHLFFDKAILSTTNAPTMSAMITKKVIERIDHHMNRNPDNFTVDEYLYENSRIKNLFYPSLDLFIKRSNFNEAQRILSDSDEDCGVYYKNQEMLNLLERKEFFLKDLFATFINNDENTIIPIFSSVSNFNFNPRLSDVEQLLKSCGSLKMNYTTKYMINNIRDSLPVLKEGRLNPGNVVDETLKQLANMDEDLNFDIGSFNNTTYQNYESIKNNFVNNKNSLLKFLEDTNSLYAKTLNYLDARKFKIPKLFFDITSQFTQKFNQKTLSLLIPTESLSTEELFSRNNLDPIRYNSKLFTEAFDSTEAYISNLKKHLFEIDEALVTSFPNFKLLEYLKFLNDFEKFKELDIIRKTEVVEECLKIFGEINNLANHSGLDLGVIDYNLTHEYLYVDYLFPSKTVDSGVDDKSVTKYDWENSTDQIESLNLTTVRLRRKYLEELFEKNQVKMRDVIFTKVVGDTNNIPTIAGKRVKLFETDNEGKMESDLRTKLNIGRKIFKKYKDEYRRYLPLEKSDEYDKLVKLLFFKELKDEIDRNKFIEQGRIFVKQSTEDNEKNKLQIYLKEYDISKTSTEQLKEYNQYINSNLISNSTEITSTNVKYFHDYSGRKEHPNLFDNQAEGTPEERMMYHINPSGFTSGTSVYGIMNYNFTNSLNNADPKTKKQLDKVYFKKKVFFQVYGKELNGKDIGPIELVNKSELNYILTPEIKYTHGIVFKPDGTIKLNKSGFGALAWFFQKMAEGSFLNVDEWLPFYKTLKSEGMYFIGANPEDLGINPTKKFPIMFNDYLQSLINNNSIGKINNETKEILKGLAAVGANYDKEKKLEKSYPQIKLDRLMAKKYSNQVFVEAIEFKKENSAVDKKVLALILDTDDRREKIKNDYLGNKLLNQLSFQDKKTGESFKYEYYKLKMVSKIDLLTNNDFCEASGKMNTYNTLWRYKVIKNYNDYKLLVEGSEVRDEATLRVKGLYDIHDSLKDESYYNMIQTKFQEIKNLTLKKTLKKILEDRKKNMFIGSGYPFMVIYQVRDYEGYLCQEGTKNSQKIFLTYELGEDLEFIDKGDSAALNLIDQPKGPIISEEFLAYTGHGATARFCFQKVRGSTPIETKGICSSNESDYDPLPGFSDDCTATGGSGGTCGDSILGLTRLDGIPKCELDDSEVKSKPLGPMDVSVPGNVPIDACDIYKVKGNKRVKYKIGKMFGYNNDGKYQLNNQYTLQYGNYYFRYNILSKEISLEDELDLADIESFAFNMTIAQDKYGPYLLLNPHAGVKDESGDNTEYLTRVINIFDKHFDAWKVESKMDKSSDDKNHIRDKIKRNNNLDPKHDNQYYAQKFNLPEDVLMKIANEEGIKSELVDKLKSDLEKGNYLFCSATGPGGGLCKGDFDAKPSMTLDEENEILRQQATQISSMMKNFENIPGSYFTKFPENEQLLNYMKNTMNTIKKASSFVYKRVQDVNWVVKTQLKTNADAKKLNQSNNKKFSLDNIEEQPMGDLIDESNIMADALKDLQQINLDSQREPKQCRSIEGFDNMNFPAPSDIPKEKLSKYNRNMSGRYYNYVKDEIDKKKQNISNLNDKIHKLLSQLNTLSDGMDLSGEKKQMLLSEMIQEKNKLEKMIFDIKNYEQQDRINKINEKLQKVENIRGEMEEDDFMTKKPADDMNNVSVISREDGELINMYKINKNTNPDHLLFLNGGCLQYDSDKKDISIQHCEANLLEQQFNVFRVEDKADMDKFKIRNAEQGMDRPFGIVMTKDNKCLHKENGEISVRNCDNVKNQYWDYSNITGPCNGN